MADAPGAVAEVDLVQIEIEDFVLREGSLDPPRENDLAHFARVGSLRCQQETLHHLLGDRACALRDAAFAEIGEGGAKDRDEIDSLMLEERAVFSRDEGELASWIPLVMAGRDPQMAVAATRIERGTDVDFGALSRALFVPLQASGALDLVFGTSVSDLNRCAEGWELQLRCPSQRRVVTTPFVFLGAGGGALPLLQRSRIPEAASYAGFPVSGQWLVCNDPDLSEHHFAKVYGKAKVGAPPMSVPHLDSRWIDGRRSLLFGPYAGFSSKFLKQGSLLDLPRSVRSSNLLPMLQVGVNNIPLVRYLVNQLRQSSEDRMEALKAFLPTARADDWTLSVAGQRVQIIKRTPAGGRLQLGTEVVAAADGSMAALLGASPGASTSVMIMLEILQRCFPDRLASQAWQQRLQALLPSYGQDLNADAELLQRSRDRSDALLGLSISR